MTNFENLPLMILSNHCTQYVDNYYPCSVHRDYQLHQLISVPVKEPIPTPFYILVLVQVSFGLIYIYFGYLIIKHLFKKRG